MGKGLFPIFLTLFIVVLVFGVWYAAIERGRFMRKTAEDLSICRVSDDSLSIAWKDPLYAITGYRAERHDDDILHVDVNITKGRAGRAILMIDTASVNYLEIYGKMIPVKDIPVCE